jgi:hypothetical protein
MTITTFKNMKGLIHGSNPKRICCKVAGILKVGTTEITVPPGTKTIMPMLFHGCTGDYPATFTTSDGKVYTLEKVAVRGGWIQPPNSTTVELMELHCRADEAEAECEALREEIRRLDNKFDTNSLNFLIN